MYHANFLKEFEIINIIPLDTCYAYYTTESNILISLSSCRLEKKNRVLLWESSDAELEDVKGEQTLACNASTQEAKAGVMASLRSACFQQQNQTRTEKERENRKNLK